MRTISVQESRLIDARPEDAYAVIADYRAGHPAILPARYFTGLHVERGGVGAGTLIRYGVRIGGRVREARAEVFEPQPGRLLEERNQDERGTVTTFTVTPAGDGRSRVTIATTWTSRGIVGLIEQLTAPALLRRIYREQLSNLERVARRRGG
jgi:hypothetical protein